MIFFYFILFFLKVGMTSLAAPVILERRQESCSRLRQQPSRPPRRKPKFSVPRPQDISASSVWEVRSQAFLDILREHPQINNLQTRFLWIEISRAVSHFIVKNRFKFFDSRNISVVLCGGSKLEKAFNTRTFHRCQVEDLIRRQLIPPGCVIDPFPSPTPSPPPSPSLLHP